LRERTGRAGIAGRRAKIPSKSAKKEKRREAGRDTGVRVSTIDGLVQ